MFLAACLVATTGVANDAVPLDQTAIFPADKAAALVKETCTTEPPAIDGFWTPSQDEIIGLESALTKYLLTQRAAFVRKYGGSVRDLTELEPWTMYHRQIAGLIRGGNRQIFISYYRSGGLKQWHRRESLRRFELEKKERTYDPDWWTTQPLVVMDGGASYFRVIYDCSTRTFVWYDQNGDA